MSAPADKRSVAAPAGRAVVWEWSFDLPASPERVWPLLMDTSRFNRAMGLTPFQYTEVDGRRRGRWRWLGATYVWEEPPWRWSTGVFAEAVRIYRRGPGRRLEVRYELHPASSPGAGEEGCRLDVRLAWAARGLLGYLALRLARKSFGARYRKAVGALVGSLGAGPSAVNALSRPGPPLGPAALSRLADATAELARRGVSPRVAEALVAWVRSGDDMDLERVRPRVFARRFGLGAREALLGCLHATRTGLLDLTWDLVCPHCRDVRASVRSLGEVPANTHCDVCGVDFVTQAADALDVTFRVHPSIRVVPRHQYCLSETASRGEVLIQWPLAPGAQADIPTRLSEGSYRLRAIGREEVCRLHVTRDVTRESDTRGVEWQPLQTGDLRAAEGPTLTVANPGPEEVIFVVERSERDPDALRPLELFHLQEFRDLFGNEHLAADVSLSVGVVAVLFTDIVGSTGLYAERGDLSAFGTVKQHFRDVYSVVREHDGAVLKTIGDAAMAAFHRPEDALRAAVALQARSSPERADSPVRVRISLNVGPCIAVNLNSGVDYFGHTVNVAAKMQSLVGAGQIALPAALMSEPAVAELVAECGARVLPAVLPPLAGRGPVDVCVWSLHPAPGP